MKGLWTALSVFALANLIALVAVGAWLVKSDRLDMERAKHIRELMTTTISEEKAASQAQLATLEQEKVTAEAARKEKLAPLTAAEQLEARVQSTELDRQRAERLKREVQDLRQTLAGERVKLDADWAALRDAQKAHADQVKQNIETVGSEQFQKTLTVLSKLEPKDATSVLLEVLKGSGVQPLSTPPSGPTPAASPASAPTPSGVADVSERPGMQKVLAYVDAMDDKVRTAIVTELVKQDQKLAAELLEALRVRGTFAAVAKGAP
ncbi:MAG: hypothetical protein ACOYN0_02965 [Phycisphaerales bacterium]